MKCERCGSTRIVSDSCFTCWRPVGGDWVDGRMEPITDRVVWEFRDGTRWQWARDGQRWYRQVTWAKETR
jgi:hypothetical protein